MPIVPKRITPQSQRGSNIFFYSKCIFDNGAFETGDVHLKTIGLTAEKIDQRNDKAEVAICAEVEGTTRIVAEAKFHNPNVSSNKETQTPKPQNPKTP